MLSKTVVLWDLNTCPVPADIEPGRVRQRIESALVDYIGEPRVFTFYALGNLEYISDGLLKEISSSGILLRHAPFGGNSVRNLLKDWKWPNLPPDELLLISGTPSWYHNFGMKSTIIRAHPDHLPPLDLLPPGASNILVWEELLQGGNSALHEISSHTDYEGPPAICTVCSIDFESCVELIHHLKTEEHMAEVLEWVPNDENGNPLYFCQLCNYPGYDQYNMFIHYHSVEHEHKVEKNNLLNDTFRYASEEASTPITLPVVESGFKRTTFTKTVVLWDLDTCPVPADIEPGRVRQRIESALREYLGETRQFSFYALGNLEHISDDLLKEMSSSGFLLRHATSGGSDVGQMMADWGMCYQHLPPAELMLISGDPWWYMDPRLKYMESVILCAHPKDLPPSGKHVCLGNTWVWEELLEGDDSVLHEISSHTDYVGPPAVCRVCNIDIESCVELINHLKTDEEHIAKVSRKGAY
ncbi:unnamed protein product [Microthlaspi erraticum]|uniref:C2H2-type domain-containing protein n=1 Tax=Microthlaspi erraticum TaxID=1685480 RepID=A0A6D2HFJ6_9BRAS|nr:unnamed protein product [Microthlaspi erraticum]